MSKKTAIIIGAGPAGLTAAYELLNKTDIIPIVYEKSADIGGISKTVNYKGNRIDIGGHRFFSKSDRVMNWWKKMMPIADESNKDNDAILLQRSRLSRILFLHCFFGYPISLSVETVRNLGLFRTMMIGFSYIKACILPIRPELTLEDFMINRFGRALYLTFFKSYTEKVWGVECKDIGADWGAQRIKGISISSAISHAVKNIFNKKNKLIDQKDVETSLIDQFLYPKLGPGQMWEQVVSYIESKGGKVILNHDVTGIHYDGNRISSLDVVDTKTQEKLSVDGDYVFSTMPISELIAGMSGDVPTTMREIATGLCYRDFMTVGLLIDQENNSQSPKYDLRNLMDNWIYVQEPDVCVGRLQLFNNWSPYLVKDPSHTWVGLEYFCDEGDHLWNKTDKDMIDLAKEELYQLGMLDKQAVLDGVVIRMPKTYPAYWGTYERMGEFQSWVNTVDNLFLIGRNGMHRYNNQDHSMLTAMTAVDSIINDSITKESIWTVNTETDYHEEKS